jgi:hypothetical protein
MTTFTLLFSSSAIQVIPSQDGLSNIIHSVSYRICANHGTHYAYKKLTTSLPLPNADNFIDYRQITEAQLVEWLEQNEPTMAAVKAELEQQLQDLANTPVTTSLPLPWEIRETF